MLVDDFTQTERPKPKRMDEALDLLYMLTDFHAYDSLVDSGRHTEEVTKMLQQLARQALA